MMNNRRGMVLVLTLGVLALMIALTVQFIESARLHAGFMANWERTRELQLTASSGISLGTRVLLYELDKNSYSYPGRLDIPPLDPYQDGTVAVAASVEDEDAKFKLTTLVSDNGLRSDTAYESFVRLLQALELKQELADRIVDWMDKDSGAAQNGSETDVRNAPLKSVEELLMIPGVEQQVYDKLKPYVTVFGSGRININSADAPVLMSLSDSISRELAQRVISSREQSPFKSTSDITKVAGFETLGIGLLGRISVKGTAFLITSEAAATDGIRSTVQCVINSSGKVLYWKE